MVLGVPRTVFGAKKAGAIADVRSKGEAQTGSLAWERFAHPDIGQPVLGGDAGDGDGIGGAVRQSGLVDCATGIGLGPDIDPDLAAAGILIPHDQGCLATVGARELVLVGEVPDLRQLVDGAFGDDPGERPSAADFFAIHIDPAVVAEAACRIVEGGQGREVRRAEAAEVSRAADMKIGG